MPIVRKTRLLGTAVQEKDLKVTTSGKMAFKKKIVNTKYINFFKLNLFTHIIFTYNSNLYHRQACFAKEAMDADVTSERGESPFQQQFQVWSRPHVAPRYKE